MDKPPYLLFVLGIQRSGTTWLSNILDSSPDTLLFMEPFAPDNGLFPELPEQGFFLKTASPENTRLMANMAQKRLLQRKSLLFAQSITDPRLFRFERFVARVISRFKTYLPSRLAQRVTLFTRLNFNRLEESSPLYTKAKDPRCWVVKELRFAGKVPLLQAAYPNARYLVMIRSPHGTVHSMLNWFDRGHLGELKRELETFIEKIECQDIGKEYSPQITVARAGGISHRAALYWRVCYEQMVRTLDQGQLCYRILPYEALASQPFVEVRQLFTWAEIPWANSITKYLDYSSGNDTVNPSATNTVRRSDKYYSLWQNKISPEVRRAVDKIVEGSFLLNHIRPFYHE